MPENIKIAYLCSDVGIPVLGFMGCSVHVREMASALAALGQEIIVYAPFKGEGNQFPHKIVEVKRLKKKWIPRDLRLILSNMNLFWACRKQFQLDKPHFIYERYGLYGWAGMRLARKFSIPLIVEINTLLAEEEKDRLHFPGLARMFETTILKRADAVCCNSEIMRSLLLKRGLQDEKILVTPNGINLEKFNSSVDGGEIRKRYKLEEKVIVGFVGILKRLWGIYTIVECAKQVFPRHNALHFMIVGAGKELEDIERLIEANGLTGRFTLTGGVSHSDIPKYIAAMDIGIAPYCRKEPFHGSAMKIFEYMAMGKPVIASAQGQIKTVINHGENGLLIEPDDSDGLAKAILKLGGDKSEMSNMGMKARATVQNYTWAANARKVLAAYRSLVDGKTGSAYEL
jgi:glycosyltransferase involved in cell wall biosynthesis